MSYNKDYLQRQVMMTGVSLGVYQMITEVY